MSWIIIEQGGKRRRVAVAPARDGVWVGWQGGATLLGRERAEAHAAALGDEVRAPMTGKIVEVKAAPGADVRRDDVLVVMEAMKMEYRLTAPRDGHVDAVRCAPGQLVDLGQTLVALKPAA